MDVTNIIYTMLSLRYFPKKWKSPEKFMLPKHGNSSTFPQNYRSTSLLPAMFKFAVRIIARFQHLTREIDILPQIQFGFRWQQYVG